MLLRNVAQKTGSGGDKHSLDWRLSWTRGDFAYAEKNKIEKETDQHLQCMCMWVDWNEKCKGFKCK